MPHQHLRLALLTLLLIATPLGLKSHPCCSQTTAAVEPAVSSAKPAQAAAAVTPPSAELRAEFSLADHYQKSLVLEGFPIVASAKVPDAALEEAAATIKQMLKNRPDILRKLAENKIRLAIMATDERTCDVPEHADLAPAEFWNVRARGLGATRQRPAVSCGEENLLHNPGDPYSTESIMVHEFAHALHLMAVNDLDSTFDQRLERTYREAMDRGLWKDKYAAENSREYFAEAVQSWFGTNREDDHDHNHVNTRQELIDYDPAVARLCAEVFGENDWSYVRADDATRADEPHLRNLDRASLKRFAWTKAERAAYDQVSEGGASSSANSQPLNSNLLFGFETDRMPSSPNSSAPKPSFPPLRPPRNDRA